MTNKKLLAGILGILLVFSFVLVGCDNGNGGDPESELAEWNGTWNSYLEYYDEDEIVAILKEQHEQYKNIEGFEDFDVFKNFVKSVVLTDFGSFVIQDNTITFYKEKDTSGGVLETVLYTFMGTLTDVWGAGTAEEAGFDWYAFKGDREGDHKYLLLEEAGRDTSSGPLHFHMRYGSKGFADLLLTPTDNYSRWAPTIVSYDTTIAELKEFMSGD